MNKVRRKEITECLNTLSTLKDELQVLLDEEQDYFDNIPENLQTSERYEV